MSQLASTRRTPPVPRTALGWHVAAVLALAGGAACAQPLPPAAHAVLSVQQRHAQAQIEYEQGHYATAFAEFAALADLGHADAARTAALMSRFGQALYGMAFPLAPERLAAWRGQLPRYAMAPLR